MARSFAKNAAARSADRRCHVPGSEPATIRRQVHNGRKGGIYYGPVRGFRAPAGSVAAQLGRHMRIEQEIAAWDGKSAVDIKSIYDVFSSETNFADSIIALSFTQACEKGATWLLKAWLEAGNVLDQAQVAKIYGSLDQLEHWEAKLHVLQSIPFMSIAEADSSNLYNFLKLSLTDQNKFVRAWSYNGFYELSMQHSIYLNETKQYIEMAMRDETPSVKARIRNIMKKGL